MDQKNKFIAAGDYNTKIPGGIRSTFELCLEQSLDMSLTWWGNLLTILI